MFIQEFVLSFGFLGGLFTRIGIDPEEVAYRALLKVAIPNNDSLVSLVIILIVVATTLAGIFGTLSIAGWPGLFVVGMAWVSGFIITVNSSATVGAILFIAVMFVGPIVAHNSKGSGGF